MAERFAEQSKNPFSGAEVLTDKERQETHGSQLNIPALQQFYLRIKRDDVSAEKVRTDIRNMPSDFRSFVSASRDYVDTIADPQKLQGFDGIKYYAIKILDFENAEEFNRVVSARDYSELGRAVSGMGYDFYEFLGKAVNHLAQMAGMPEQAMYERLFFLQMQQVVIRMAQATQAGEREKDEKKRREEQLEKLNEFEAFMVSDVQGLKGSKLPEGEQVKDVVGMLGRQAASIGFDLERMFSNQPGMRDLEAGIMLGIRANLAAGPIAPMGPAFQY